MTSMTPEPRGPWLAPRVVFGLLVVAFGTAMLLDNLRILDAGNLLRYWPFGMMAVGVSYILRADSRSQRIFGGILTVVGALFVAEIFFFVRLDIWRWWPLFIVFIGVKLVSRAFQPQETNGKVQVGVVFGGSG